MENESGDLALFPGCYAQYPHYRRASSHDRHCVRRFAFKVPHEMQRRYMLRANQDVMTALNPRMAISTTAFRSSSFNS